MGVVCAIHVVTLATVGGAAGTGDRRRYGADADLIHGQQVLLGIEGSNLKFNEAHANMLLGYFWGVGVVILVMLNSVTTGIPTK